MGGKASREKGKRFERTAAKKFREHGYNASRGVQYCGKTGAADVVGVPGLHLEMKAVEALNIYNAMAQSKADARTGELPVVVHKKNNHNILVTMEFDDWIELYKSYEMDHNLKERCEGDAGDEEKN